MAFTLQDWQDVIKQERRRLSSLVNRARKVGVEVKLVDIAGEAPRPTTVDEAKQILAEYKAWTSYHDVVEAMRDLNTHTTPFDFDFTGAMNIPVPEATEGVRADKQGQTLQEFYSYMSTVMVEDNVSITLFKDWWNMLHQYYTDYDIADAIQNLIRQGITYRDIKFGSDWQSVQEVNDYANRLMQELKHSSSDSLAAEDAITEWTNTWEDIEQNKQAFYAEWFQSKLL